MMYFPAKRGAKETQNPQNHRVEGFSFFFREVIRWMFQKSHSIPNHRFGCTPWKINGWNLPINHI